ncbi:PAS domain S-box protein [Desulfocastanea catecholica]
MKPLVTIFGAAFFFSLVLSSPQLFSADKNQPQEVTAIALRNWPPQFLTDEKTGKPSGFAIDIMNRVAALSDLKIRYAMVNDWPEAIAALDTGQALLTPNMGITAERLALYDFTAPYETFRISLFVHSDASSITATSDLGGKKVGVVTNNQGLVLMRQQGGSELQVYDSVEKCFLALLSGDIDALVYSEQLIKKLALRSGLEKKIKTVGKPLQEVKHGIAIRKGNPELFNKLDAAMRHLLTTTEYQDIYEKWYGRPQPFWNVNRVILATSILFSVTMIGLLTWRHMSIVRLNRTLSEARDRFRTIIENTDTGYFRLDRDGIYQQVNTAWLKMHGYASPAEVIGRHFTLTQVDVDLKTAQQNVTKLLSGARIPSGELARRCQDGSIGYHTFSAHPVMHKGQLVGVEGFIIDRTDLKEAEQALRKSEEKHRLLFEYAGDAILIYNSQSHLLAINPMACELLGYTHAELMAMTIDRIRTEKESLYSLDQVARVMAEGNMTFETVYQRKDGSTVPIEVNARRITWEDQPAIMSICRDITERKRGEEQVIRLQKAESLKRMAGAIAHHFNNQLTVVLGNLELTLDDLPADAKNRQNLVAAMQAATRAAEVSGLMLTYLGQGIDRSQKIDLSEACRQNLPILEATLPQGITLQTDLLNPGPVVLANPSQLQTLLLHLLTNGTEALAEQEGRVRLATGTVQANILPQGFTMPGEWQPRADSYAFLEVTDSGCGMSTEEMENLFDPFYTTKFTGRGLGLSVVLGLVKAWDGAISVLSREDHGSTFRVLLPLCKEEIPVQALTMDRAPDLEHNGFVLLVDDQPDVREMGKAMLKRLGYASLSAADGTEALALLRQHRGMVRCVITDLSMPGMDGWETIAALRKIEPDLPVILSSGFEGPEVMGQDNKEYPVIFLHKPYTMIDLHNALSRSIQDTRPGNC